MKTYTIQEISKESDRTEGVVRGTIRDLQESNPDIGKDIYVVKNRYCITENGKKILMEALNKKQRYKISKLTRCLKCENKLNKIETNQNYCKFCDTWYSKGEVVTFDKSGNIQKVHGSGI